MKPYIYKVRKSPRPEQLDKKNIEKSPLFYRYKRKLGSPSDPNAYVNKHNETLVTNLMRWDYGPKDKISEFGMRAFSTPESMIEYYNDCCQNYPAYLIKDAVVVSNWEEMGGEEWKEKNAKDKSIRLPKRETAAYEAPIFASWKNGDVYKCAIIDNPSFETSFEAEYLDSEKKLPKGKVVWESKMFYGDRPGESVENLMKKIIVNRSPREEYEYDIAGHLTESMMKKYGFPVYDEEIGSRTAIIENGSYIDFRRSKNTKTAANKRVKR